MTRPEGRRFAFTVGAAFLVLAAVLRWREVAVASAALGVVGGALIAAGVLVPSRLGPVQRAWMDMAHALSRVTTPVLMGIVFFLTILPIAVMRRRLGGNPVVRRESGGGYWIERAAGSRRSDLERQF